MRAKAAGKRLSLLLSTGCLLLFTLEARAENVPAAPKPAPQEAVVLDPNLAWRASGWAGGSHTPCVWEEAAAESRVFTVTEPQKRCVWVYYFSSPVPLNQYPKLILTYKARNIAATGDYVIWLDDTRGPDVGGVVAVKCRAIVADGEVHNFTRDLLSLNPGSNSITGIALGVTCGEAGPASLEVLSLRFEKAPDVAADPIEDDASMTVKVVDGDGKPVSGATVSVDAERLNFARSAQTGENGLATVTPLKVSDGKHMLRVTRPDGSRVEWAKVAAGGKEPLAVTINPAVVYSGKVVDEAGAPIAGGAIEFWVDGITWRGRNEGPHAVAPSNVGTNAEGRWRSPPIDGAATGVHLRLSHPEFVSDLWADQSNKTVLAEVRAGTAVSVMHRGITVSGIVRRPDGRPITGASVAQGEDRFPSNAPPATRTDAEGKFLFKRTRPGNLVLTFRAPGCAPEVMRLTAEPKMDPLDITLGAPNTIRFRVVDAKGGSIQQARVRADTWRGYRTLEWDGNTGPDGRIAWTSAPADEVEYYIYADGRMSVRNKKLTAREEEYVITLPPLLKITGKVTDAETGKPVEQFKVVEGIGWEQRDDINWQRRDRAPARGGEYSQTFSFPYPNHYVRIEADGYAPAVSRAFKSDEGEQVFDFKLKKAVNLTGVMRDKDGHAVAGAQVAVLSGSDYIAVRNGEINDDRGNRASGVSKTDAEGRYSVPQQPGKFQLVATAKEGFASVLSEELDKTPDVALQAWGRVEGVYLIGSKPGARKEMTLWPQGAPQSQGRGNIRHDLQTTTDDAGRFVFARVPPGKLTVSNYMQLGDRMWGGTKNESLTVEAGQTATVTLGGTGRPVIGALAYPPDNGRGPKRGSVRAALNTARNAMAMPTYPAGWAQMTPEQQREWWATNPEAKEFQKRQQEEFAKMKRYDVQVQADGTFRVEDVPAGEYDLNVSVSAVSQGRNDWNGEYLGGAHQRLTVPPMEGGRSDEPLDVGKIAVRLKRTLIIGDVAPDFEMTTLDGKKMKLSDLRGKLVLLALDYFERPDADLPAMAAVWKAVGADPRFAMVGVMRTDTLAALKVFAEKQKIEWPQSFLSRNGIEDLAYDYVSKPGASAIFLIGPKGDIVAWGLTGEQIGEAVTYALKNMPKVP